MAIAPLAVIPGGENRFVFGKICVFATAVGVSCFAVRRGRLPRTIAWLLIAGFAVAALSAGLGWNPMVAIVGAAPRYEGLPILALYAGCGWAGARLLGPAAPREALRTLEWSLTVTAVGVGFVAVLEAAGLRPLASNVARPGSLLGTASDEGALGVLLAGTLGWIALRHIGQGRRLSAAMVGAGAASVVVALSASRAALVGLVVAALILAVASPWRWRLVLTGAIVAVAFITLIAPGSRARVTGSSPLATETVHGRLLLWDETLGLIGRHPVIGIGPGVYVDRITSEHDLQWQKQVGPDNPPDSPHDWVLQVASVGGIPLLALVIALCAWSAMSGWRLIRAASASRAVDEPVDIGVGAFAGLAGYGVALLFGFTTPGTTPLAAALGGIVVAQPPGLSAVPSGALLGRLRGGVRWIVATGATLLLVMAALGAVAEIQVRDALVAAAMGDVGSSDSRFRSAAALRPWDASIDETAGHALLVVAQSRSASAQAALGAAGYWLGKADRRLPNHEQVELDEATLAELHTEYGRSQALLDRVLGHDKQNPAVMLRLGVVQGERGQLAQAAATFMEVTRVDPASPDPWEDLAIVYKLENRLDLAAQATARAQQLRR